MLQHEGSNGSHLGNFIPTGLTARITAMALAVSGIGGGAGVALANVAHAPQVPTPSTLDLYTNDTPDSINSAVTADGGAPNQAQDNTIGASAVNSLPGFSEQFAQTVTGITTGSSPEITFQCPSPASLNPTVPSFESLTINPGNSAAAEFCASDELVTESSVDLSDPAIAQDLTEYQNDPLRSGQPWAGDKYNYDLFLECPSQIVNESPMLSFKYSMSRGSVVANFYRIGYGQYCDIVGMSTEQLSAQVKKPGSKTFKQVGQTVLHVDGLWESLGYYRIPSHNGLEQVQIPGVDKLCKSEHKGHNKPVLRVSEKLEFIPNQGQDFQHVPFTDDTVSTGMHSASTTSTSTHKIC
jgi:hypothetical protein